MRRLLSIGARMLLHHVSITDQEKQTQREALPVSSEIDTSVSVANLRSSKKDSLIGQKCKGSRKYDNSYISHFLQSEGPSAAVPHLSSKRSSQNELFPCS